jgi:hypothetical protein
MNMNSHPPSAKIYQFPQKTAAAAIGLEMNPARDHLMRAVPNVEFGSGWYHDAAVQAEGTRPFHRPRLV